MDAGAPSSAAGAAKFSGSNSRKFSTFQPKGRRATVYEDVLMDVQYDPKRYLLQGWFLEFPNGKGVYSEESSRMRSSDWHMFRDPNEEWQRTSYIRQSSIEKQIALTVATAKAKSSFHSLESDWLHVLQNHLGAWKHPEYGISMNILLPAQRDAMTNTVNTAIAMNCSDKLRFAQDVAIYMMDIAEQVPEFSEAAGKDAWLYAPVWQGVRRNIEKAASRPDWAEQVLAINLVYEPLCGELFRSHFLMQFAAHHGDYVTPTLVSTAEADYEKNLRWTLELFKMLLEDTKYAHTNRELVQEWLETYVPLSVSAAQMLEPIWSEPRIKVSSFESCFEKAMDKFEYVLQQLNLQLPKGVTV